MGKILHYFLIAACSCFIASAADAGTTAYGYLFSSKDGKRGFVSFDIDTPQKLNLKANDYGYVHMTAGEYVDGKIYAYRAELDDDYGTITPYDWAVYDASTNKLIEHTPVSGNRVADMTYDYTTNTLYAIIEDEYTTGSVRPTSLYVIDMKTGARRLIGSPGKLTAIDGYGKTDTDGLITLACDAEGQLYAMSHYRYLYKVDKFTGAVTSAAPRHNLGTAEQFQSMTFAADGKLWWAQQHPSYAHFCEIDLGTGIPGGFVDFTTDYEKLKKLGNDSQVTAIFFKDKEVNGNAPLSVTDLKAVTSAEDPYTVNLTWTLPAADYSGNAPEIKGVRIYIIGLPEPVATVEGEATSYTVKNTPNGMLTFEVIPFNESGNGFPAFAETFAGMDQLNEVQNITSSIADNNVTVKWERPVSTVNGGYADYEAITYNVYRKLAQNEVKVADGISATEFSEILETPGSYTYVIEPVCGGVIGVRAESPAVVLSTVASIPYFSGFEDNEDGSLWTIINKNTGNYGWQPFGVKSYEYSGKSAYAVTGGASALGDDWLISPAIEIPAGSYILEFYGNGASYDKVSLDVCLGTDNTDTASFDQTIYSLDNDYLYDAAATPKGWKHVVTKFTVASTGVYHLGFHHKTKTTYANTRIDNVSVKSDSSGIGTLTGSNDDAPVEYYNIQGMKVDNPAPGLYIRRQGNTVSKVIIR